VVARLLVHDRRENPGPRCPCCLSPDAEIIESRVMVDVVIDLEDGSRIYEADVSPEAWAEKVALADAYDIPLRCSDHTRDLFLDESGRHLALSGAQRAAKTTTALYLFALDVLRRGGLNRRAWLVAPTDQKAHILLQKLLRPTPVGESGSAPAILPPGLVARTPETHRTSDLTTVLIDGTIIDLRSFAADPGASRLKSDPCISIVCDEAAHLPSGDSLAALVGRTVDAGGRLVLASTPRPSAVMTSIVVEPAMEFARMDPADPRKLSGDHPGAPWIFRSLPLADNVFLNQAKIRRAMRGVDMSRPENRRDWLGEWVSNEGRCWVNFTNERHVVVHEARTVGALSPRVLAEHRAGGHVDITPTVARGLFGKASPHVRLARASNFRFVLGQDVNVSPMTTALVQVTAPADKLEDRDSWHYWIVDVVSTPTSNSLAHAERLVSAELARVLDPDGKGSPVTGCGVIMDATAIGRDPTAHKYGSGQSGSGAETFWRYGLDARAPAYRPTASKGKQAGGYNPEIRARWTLIHRLVNEGRLHVFSRAGALLTSLDQQLVSADGIVPIDARSGRFDSMMSAPDAMSYAIYAMANMKVAAPVTMTAIHGL
jgi:hypothetical protein